MKLKSDENILQQELHKFEDFCNKNKLVINSGKCFVMLFSRSRTFAFPPEFTVGKTEILEVKKTLRVLGVLIQDDGKWAAQVEEMVRRATRTTWVLRRMRSLGVDQTTLVDYWKAEGRIHLEFACPVWHSGLTASQAQDLERAQRMAMAAITGRWEPSHTHQLLELGLERLRPPTQGTQTCSPSQEPGKGRGSWSGHTGHLSLGLVHTTTQLYHTSPGF